MLDSSRRDRLAAVRNAHLEPPPTTGRSVEDAGNRAVGKRRIESLPPCVRRGADQPRLHDRIARQRLCKLSRDLQQPPRGSGPLHDLKITRRGQREIGGVQCGEGSE